MSKDTTSESPKKSEGKKCFKCVMVIGIFKSIIPIEIPLPLERKKTFKPLRKNLVKNDVPTLVTANVG